VVWCGWDVVWVGCGVGGMWCVSENSFKNFHKIDIYEPDLFIS